MWMMRNKHSESRSSADLAKFRLLWIIGFDRQQEDGRARAVRFGPGVQRLIFDQTVSIGPDEDMYIEYSIEEDGIHGYGVTNTRR